MCDLFTSSPSHPLSLFRHLYLQCAWPRYVTWVSAQAINLLFHAHQVSRLSLSILFVLSFLARLLSASLWVWGRSFKNSLGCKWWENGRRKFSWRGISGWENCWFRIWTGALLMNTFEIYQFLHHVRLSFKWAPKPLFIPLLFFFKENSNDLKSCIFGAPSSSWKYFIRKFQWNG